MKRALALVGLALALTLAVACSQDSGNAFTSSPTAVAGSSDFQSVSAEVKSTVRICHFDIDDDNEFLDYEVIEVSGNGSSEFKHCTNHDSNGDGDYNENGTNGCFDCAVDLSSFELGEDCSSCQPI